MRPGCATVPSAVASGAVVDSTLLTMSDILSMMCLLKLRSRPGTGNAPEDATPRAVGPDARGRYGRYCTSIVPTDLLRLMERRFARAQTWLMRERREEAGRTTPSVAADFRASSMQQSSRSSRSPSRSRRSERLKVIGLTPPPQPTMKRTTSAYLRTWGLGRWLLTLTAGTAITVGLVKNKVAAAFAPTLHGSSFALICFTSLREPSPAFDVLFDDDFMMPSGDP